MFETSVAATTNKENWLTVDVGIVVTSWQWTLGGNN